MAVLPIFTDGAPVLRKKADPVKGMNDNIIQLIMDMFETMRSANGIGLAANQVGILKRIIVVDLSEVEGMENAKPLALINPKILEQQDKWVMEEGCLSVPEIRDDIERAKKLKIIYKDTNFNDIEIEVNGLLGRVILHEIDHLDGILFIDRIPPSKRKQHTEALNKIRHGEIEVSYPIITAADVQV
ncbi:MAG: peptide deformylase [Bacteroidota bacterium]|nr:peptide deformylase [Bacteroidota bacterium]